MCPLFFIAAVSRTTSYQKNPFLNNRPHENHKERIDEISHYEGIHEESDDLEPAVLLEGDFAFIHFLCCQPGICHTEYPYDDPWYNEQEHANNGSKKYHHSFSQLPVVHLAKTGEA